MILSDNEIGLLCEGEQPMISPFLASQISANNHGARLLSYGVSSYGYDVQLAEQFQIFSNQAGVGMWSSRSRTPPACRSRSTWMKASRSLSSCGGKPAGPRMQIGMASIRARKASP